MTSGPQPEWLLISVSTAKAADTLRVHVWRKLRSLGALYLQQSVCLLPAQPGVVRDVRRLVDRIHHQGGSARVLSTAFTVAAEEQSVIAEFNSARDTEYAEVLERLPSFLEELETELARGRATYAEVEESEADLERFRSWLAKIAARDYFDAHGGKAARDAMIHATEALTAFEQATLNVEAPVEEPPHVDNGPRLRAVED